jgi:hypothetical protein
LEENKDQANHSGHCLKLNSDSSFGHQLGYPIKVGLLLSDAEKYRGITAYHRHSSGPCINQWQDLQLHEIIFMEMGLGRKIMDKVTPLDDQLSCCQAPKQCLL